jgi:hypothetical protein
VAEIDRGPRHPAAASAATPSAITSTSPAGCHARQLDAGLDELALASPRALEAHDRALVARPHGARLVAESAWR